MSDSITENTIDDTKRVTVDVATRVWDEVKDVAREDGRYIGRTTTNLLREGLRAWRERQAASDNKELKKDFP